MKYLFSVSTGIARLLSYLYLPATIKAGNTCSNLVTNVDLQPRIATVANTSLSFIYKGAYNSLSLPDSKTIRPGMPFTIILISAASQQYGLKTISWYFFILQSVLRRLKEPEENVFLIRKKFYVCH